MSVLKRWVIPGAVAVGAVAGISLSSETSKIEADLTSRSQQLLIEKGMDWASVEFNGRDGVLKGTAPEENMSADAVAMLRDAWGVRVMEDQSELLPAQKPYTWGLENGIDKISMFGYLPYKLVKSTPDMIKSVFEGTELSSGVEAARGAPAGIGDAVDLSSRILKALPGGKAMLVDDQLTISGQLEDGNADHVALFGELKDVVASAKLDGITLDFQVPEPKKPEPPIQSPFTWELNREGNKLAMSGYVPKDLAESVPSKVSDLAAGNELSSNLSVARGAPKGFAKVVDLSAKLLKQLPNGKTALSDTKLTVSGILEDGNKEHAALFANVKELVDSAQLDDVAIDFQIAQPGPALNGFSIKRTENGVDLSGAVPSDEIKQELITLAQRKFGASGVSDGLEVWPGIDIAGLAAKDYSKITEVAMQVVSRLGEGEANLTSDGFDLKGGAFYDKAINQLKKLLSKQLPKGLEVKSDLTVAAPGEAVAGQECQSLLRTALEKNTILFDSGRASISADSFGLLDGLIYTAHRCQDSRLQIEGHTDSDGNDAANQTLSEARAASVVKYLVAAGLGKDRLEAKGFGETKPVADNGTPEGKAKNRRIEFLILAE